MAAKTAIVVLAAGEGTRMHSRVPKVLHRIAGRPLIAKRRTLVSEFQTGRSSKPEVGESGRASELLLRS